MITLTNRDTFKPCHVDAPFISEIMELHDIDEARVYPYTRLHIINPKEKHDFTIDVIESKKKILKLIEEEKLNAQPKSKAD